MDLVVHKSIRIDMRWLGHQALAQPTPRRGASQRAHSAAVKVELLNRLPVGRYLQVRHLWTWRRPDVGAKARDLQDIGHRCQCKSRSVPSGPTCVDLVKADVGAEARDLQDLHGFRAASARPATAPG